jgi:hypothetical protein
MRSSPMPHVDDPEQLEMEDIDTKQSSDHAVNENLW